MQCKCTVLYNCGRETRKYWLTMSILMAITFVLCVGQFLLGKTIHNLFLKGQLGSKIIYQSIALFKGCSCGMLRLKFYFIKGTLSN